MTVFGGALNEYQVELLRLDFWNRLEAACLRTSAKDIFIDFNILISSGLLLETKHTKAAAR